VIWGVILLISEATSKNYLGKKTMKIDLTIFIAFIALFLSILSIYLQYFRIKGPRMSLLNEEGDYKSVLRPYNGLPSLIRDNFPEYIEKYPGYAIVVLVFGNAGDREGLAKIVNVAVKNPPFFDLKENESVKTSFYDYNMIPPYSIASKYILLRNIPVIVQETKLTVTLEIEWGGVDPKKTTFVNNDKKNYEIKISLVPSKFNKDN